MDLKHWAERNPYWLVILLELVVIAVYYLAGAIASFLGLSSLAQSGIANFGLAVLAAALLTLMGWWRAVGFRRPSAISDFWYYLVPFIPAVINFIPGLYISTPRHLVVVISVTFLAGFAEESFFRGLMLNAMRSRGAWQAVILTALLFGLTHVFNSTAPKDLAAAGLQAVHTTVIGFAFAALVLRKGLIWPLVMARFLTGFSSLLRNPRTAFTASQNLWITLTMTIILFAFGIFVMLQAAKPPIADADA